MIRMMQIVAVMAVAAMASGCASALVVRGRNADLDTRAVQLAATPNGATAAVDLLGLKGYWAAWKAEPAKMTGATLLDVGAAGLTAWGVQQATKSSDSESTPNIENNGGTVIINTGSGNASYSTTQSGAAE